MGYLGPISWQCPNFPKYPKCHSTLKHQRFLKCPWVTSQIFSRKFQLHFSYGSKVFALWILLKISQHCLLSAASKIVVTVVSNHWPRKTVTLKFGFPTVFHSNKPFLASDLYNRKSLVLELTFVKNAKKNALLGGPESFFWELWNKYHGKIFKAFVGIVYIIC